MPRIARRLPRRQTGFTLLEVLVAFVLAAIGIVALIQAFAGGLRNLRKMDEYVVAAMVADIAADSTLTRVDELTRRWGMNVRRLQRLFADYVGASPKWVIRRYRMQEAAARAAAAPVDWARLAFDLGYSDQAHLTRDFTEHFGMPPGRYLAANTPG